MPNASDPAIRGGQLPLSHNPLKRLNYVSVLPDVTPAELEAAEEAAITAFLQVLDQQTGIDLTGWWNQSLAVKHANQAFNEAVQTALDNYTDWPTFWAAFSAAWNTWIVTATSLASNQTINLEQLLDKIWGVNSSTGLMSPGNVGSSTGLATLNNDLTEMMSPFTSITNLTSTTAWQNAWNGLEELLGVPIVGPNDVQTISQTTSGTQTVSFNGNAATSTISNGDSAATVLAALSTITALNGNISVTGTGPWTVTFINALGGAVQPLMTSTGTGVTIAHTTPSGGLTNNTPTQIHPAQVSNVLGNGDIGTDVTQMATSLFGSAAVNNITIIGQDIINFIGNAVSGGNAATSPNSPAASILDALMNIPHNNVVIPPSPGSGTITHDVNSHPFSQFTGPATGLTTLGWAHPGTSAANYMVARVLFYCTSALSISVTCDGEQMQLLQESIAPDGYTGVGIYGIPNPSPGADISVTGWAPFGSYLGVLAAEADTLIGVGSVNATAAQQGFNSSPALIAPSATGDYLVQVFGLSSPSGTETLGTYNKTLQYNSGTLLGHGSSDAGCVLLAGDAAGAASVSFTAIASYTTLNNWAAASVNFTPLPSDLMGSGFKAANTSTSAVNAVAGNNLFPNSFFGTQVAITADGSYSAASGNTYTVEHAGWYTVTIAVLLVSTFGNQWLGINMVKTPNGGSAETHRGDTKWIGGFSANTVCAFTFQDYFGVGDKIQPGYYSSISGSAFTGTVDGLSTYFRVQMGNRGLHS